MKYVWGGRQVMSKVKPELEAFDKNPKDYDLIFIGTPVWVFTYAPALLTFFESASSAHKKVAVFCCSGGGKGKTLEKMKEKLKDNEILGQIDFVEPLRFQTGRQQDMAASWAKEVLGKVTGAQ